MEKNERTNLEFGSNSKLHPFYECTSKAAKFT